jgi:regulator of cell morphogenesis and NO signaling
MKTNSISKIDAIDDILDVTLIEPKLKHPTIFQKFDELKEGESFTIKNDHDPRPLHYQLLAERGEIFDWIYKENGPEVWLVKITKKLLKNAGTAAGNASTKNPVFNNIMEDSTDRKVGEIASENPVAINIFKKYGIDFCCGGDKTLKEACNLAGIDEDIIASELNKANSAKFNGTAVSATNNTERFNEWSISFLIEYIIQNHHSFIRKHIPEITEYLEKINNVHGEHHPEIKTINELFAEAASTLIIHLDKEEKDLFISIKDIENDLRDNKNLKISTTLDEIKKAKLEHEHIGDIFKKIENLSSNFLIPEDACASYSHTYKLLKEFYDDIRIHIHLENNILFKKALEFKTKDVTL